jgi:chemotaxis protein methyltransferase CheR
MPHEENKITEEEMNRLLSLIRDTYGYDFTSYSRASLLRRFNRCMSEAGINNAFELKYYLINNKNNFDAFLQQLTVNVTEMFRDPLFFKTIRMVLKRLNSYPTLKIWHAGCSTGEEVFSMAIVLHEEGLLDRTRIYATDLNPMNLEKAKSGLIPLSQVKDYTANYILSGGQNDFSDYYTARYNKVIINSDLRKNIVFGQHNLVTDACFNEFQLVCCRNVLIYFEKELQSKVIKLFHDSLSPRGYLALGLKESLLFSGMKNEFEIVDDMHKIFRRTT